MAIVTHTLDQLDKALLAEIQGHFPIDHRPYETLGQKLGISEQACLERISALKRHYIIRRICGVFDRRALGYHSSIVAMKVEVDRVDEAAGVITQYPGASYVSKRNDPFNLWVNIAVPPSDSLEQVVQVLHTQARAEETMILPVLQLYTVGERLDAPAQEPLLEETEDVEAARRQVKPRLSEQDIQFIRILQDDLPLLEMPFTVLAEQAETTEDALFTWAKKTQHLGFLRRFGAVAAGPSGDSVADILVVWHVPQEHVDAVGQEMARFRGVSRCDRRPVYPAWPYALFTVIQAASQSACLEIVKRIEERIGRFAHKHLFSIKEYKKIRVKLFAPELEAWWKASGSEANI